MSKKLSRTELETQLEEVSNQLEWAKQDASKAIMTMNHLCIRAYNFIEKYEKGQVGARPCVYGIKGLLEGLAMVYAQPKMEENEESESTEESIDKAEDESESGSAG